MILLRKLLKLDLSAKDPQDRTLTWNSTAGEVQQYWCRRCKTGRSHREYMGKYCSCCGGHYTINLFGCTIRRIWNGSRWINQYDEGNEGIEWTDDNREEMFARERGRIEAMQRTRH